MQIIDGAQKIQVLLFGTSWNFIFLNNFDPTLVEPMDTKTKDMEGELEITIRMGRYLIFQESIA